MSKNKADFVANARSIIQKGFEKFEGGFNVVTDDGKHQIMLPPDYIDAVNSQEKLSFIKFTEEVTCFFSFFLAQ